MSCHGNNATPPSPAIAPGAEAIDPRAAAEAVAARGMDPRLTALVPAFDAPFFQAGLSGYSDAAMRIIARRHGCPLCVTEALLDRTLLAGGRGFAKADLGEIEDNIPGGDEDHPLVGQIMGSDPREMAAAAVKMVEQAARADRDYRRMAYADGRLPDSHLRLPGGEQLGRGGESRTGQLGSEGESRKRESRIGEQLNEGRSCAPSRAADSSPPSPVPGAPILYSPLLDSPLVAPPPPTFATIDVNLACPVKKIDRKARGGHWLSEPEGAIKILEAVREAVPSHIPCTVKLRRAYDDTPEMAACFERLLDAAFAIGYGWATVHARTVEQKYVGPSRWDLLRDIVRRHPARLILGSGDVWQAADIFRMIAYTGVAAVSVARGCIGNPWLFRQARLMMAGDLPAAPTLAEQRAVLEEHFRLAIAVNGGRATGVDGATGGGATGGLSGEAAPASAERAASTLPVARPQLRRAEAFTGKTMRKFGIRFAEHHPRADEVRRRFIEVSSLDAWRAVLDDHYPADAPEPAPPTLAAAP